MELIDAARALGSEGDSRQVGGTRESTQGYLLGQLRGCVENCCSFSRVNPGPVSRLMSTIFYILTQGFHNENSMEITQLSMLMNA